VWRRSQQEERQVPELIRARTRLGRGELGPLEAHPQEALGADGHLEALAETRRGRRGGLRGRARCRASTVSTAGDGGSCEAAVTAPLRASFASRIGSVIRRGRPARFVRRSGTEASRQTDLTPDILQESVRVPTENLASWSVHPGWRGELLPEPLPAGELWAPHWCTGRAVLWAASSGAENRAVGGLAPVQLGVGRARAEGGGAWRFARPTSNARPDNPSPPDPLAARSGLVVAQGARTCSFDGSRRGDAAVTAARIGALALAAALGLGARGAARRGARAGRPSRVRAWSPPQRPGTQAGQSVPPASGPLR
jgi:hypothetical protein